MLTKVEVYNEQGLLLNLPLEDFGDGYLVKNIDGLDPVKANIVVSTFAELDGGQYQASRREQRNLVFKIGLVSNTQSVMQLRTNLYNWFMTDMVVVLRFIITGFPVVEIKGRVETFETPFFTKEPEVTISILCQDSVFYGLDSALLTGSSTETTTSTNIDYQGSVETGFLFTLNLNRPITNFTIIRNFANGFGSSMDFVGNLLNGDILEINTVDRQKGAWLTRTGIRTSVLYGIAPDSDWINFFKGENTFRVYAVGAPIPYTLEYSNKFGGL